MANEDGEGLLVQELVIYAVLGILPFLAAAAVTVAYWPNGLVALAAVSAILIYATVRMGLFLELTGLQWLITVLLVVAGYVGSCVYLLLMAYRNHRRPPPKHEPGPDYYAGAADRQESLVLDWSDSDVHGGG